MGLLARLLEAADAAGAYGYVIEILVLQAMALQAQRRLDPALAALVQRDLKDGIAIGVRGTPSIFVNGRVLQQRNLSGFKRRYKIEMDFLN